MVQHVEHTQLHVLQRAGEGLDGVQEVPLTRHKQTGSEVTLFKMI